MTDDIRLKVALVDDEEDSLQVTSYLLNKYCPNVNIQFLSNDAEDALLKLKSTYIDILFLDIEMPRITGFQLLEQLGSFNFKVIFTTAYQQYMLPAIKVKAFDYLVKPIDRNELVNSIDRLVKEKQVIAKELPSKDSYKITNSKIIVPIGNEFEFISISSITRCESENNYCLIFTDTGRKITLSKTLKIIEDQLPKDTFVRVHNSHLINITHLAKYKKTDGGFFEMQDGTYIPISRARKEEILNTLGLK